MHQGRKQEWRQEHKHNQTQNRLWEHTCDIPKFPSLHGDVKTDILIIGGGGREHAIVKKIKENPEVTEL